MRTTFKRITRDAALALVLGMLASGASAGQATAKPAGKVATATAPSSASAIEPRAMELLKATSARLAAAASMSFSATVSYEYPSKLGPAIVYTTRYDVTMRRPDKLKVVTPGDGPASEFYYDGRTMAAFAPVENLVAVAEAPATIDDTLKKAYATAAVFFPFTDLLVADPFAALNDGVRLAFYIGSSEQVGGVTTQMVAWANDDVFMQIWLGADDQLPRRLRAVFRADPLRLRHDMLLSDWQLDPPLAADAFSMEKALSAQKIAFARPVAPPPGVKPLVKGKPAKAR